MYQFSERLADNIWEIVIQHWLSRAYHRKLLTTEQTESLKSIIDKLVPQLNS